MMKFKKFLAAVMTGAMMFGSVAMAVPAISVYAEDAAVSAYTIDIDYKEYTATISSTTKADPYVILEVVKDDAGSKVSSTHSYEMNGASSITIDLSFLKAAKPSYLRVRGSSETVTSKVKTVNAMPAKLGLKYASGQINGTKSDAENIAAAFANGKTKISKEDVEKDLYEFRTLYGGKYFQPISDLQQEIAEVAGTTIIVRKAAVDAEDEKNSAPASAEVKVKIAAAPKAPKVTIDYAKGIIKLPKKAQARVVVPNATTTDPTPTASMELDTNKGDLFASADNGTTYTQVTNENLDTYFSIKADGTGVEAKESIKFASDNAGSNEVTDAVSYVKFTPAEEEKPNKPAPTGTLTAWKDITATTASQKDILGWFDETKDAKKTEDMIKSGFTLIVRTKADKKAASNPNILTFDKTAEIVPTDGKDEVKVGNDALTWKTVENGIQYTGTGFEYYDTAKSKWVAIKTGSVVKATVTADVEVEVRKAGKKATKTEAGVLPSLSTKIKVSKYVDPSATPSATPTPDIDKIDITPADDNPSDLTAGTLGIDKTLKFTAKATKGTTEVSNVTFTWSVAAPDGKTVTTGFTFAADGTLMIAKETKLLEGDYTVKATAGGKEGTTKFNVAASVGTP